MVVRVAISIADGKVCPMDSGCQQLMIADLENGHVAGRSYLENPGHGPGGPPPAFLHQLGVEKVITGGALGPTKHELQLAGIGVIQGASGSPEKVLQDYIHGDL